jgi:ribonuclease P protein component
LRGEWLDLRFRLNRFGAPRLGIAVGRKVAPSAVSRNAVKRILRERFRRNRTALPPVDLVFSLKKPAPRRLLVQDAERLLLSIPDV